MPKLANWIRETVNSGPGTGTISLSGTAVTGYIRFQDTLTTGDKVYYVAEDGNNKELGYGTLTTGSPWTLSRDVIFETLDTGVYDNTSPAAIALSASTVVSCVGVADAIGTIIQQSITQIATVVNCTATGVLDNTIPQSSEVTVVTSQAFTPRYADSDIVVKATWFGSGSAAMNCVAAILKDSDVNAVAAKAFMPSQSSPYIGEGTIIYKVAASTVTARTYKLAIGTTTGTFYANGNNAGTQLFNGVGNTAIEVLELRKP